MSLDKLHCFGSRWFCLQMQEAFTAQKNVLYDLIRSKNPKLKDVNPLLVALQTTSQAISLLRRDCLLNEAHVLMRLLVERAINVCYLYGVAKKTGAPTQDERTGEPEQPKLLSANELIQASIKLRFTEAYDSDGLETKIKQVSEQTGIPIDFLRLCISSHYPIASMALSGSLEGAVCHLRAVQSNEDGFFHEEFTTILFLGTLLLNNVIKVISKDAELTSFLDTSERACKVAAELMDKASKPPAANVQSLHGHWQTLADKEFYAEGTLERDLNEFAPAFSACVDAGVEVTFLGRTNRGTQRLKISAMFLKRMLNDLRSVWLMLCRGYTSQGASIAASLFENALAIQFICENENRAIQFKQDKSGELTKLWPVAEMCRHAVMAEDGTSTPDKNAWKNLYVQYVWLCQIKHPTLRQVFHDTGATALPSGEYAVIPLPDVREADLDVKRLICIKSLRNALSAINAFARASGVKVETDLEKAFAEKTKAVHDILVSRLKSQTGLKIPFTVENSGWVQDQLNPKPKRGKKRKR